MKGLDTRYFFPVVLQAVPSDDFKIYAYFNDGSVRCFDVKPLIKPGTVFEPLGDIDVFKSKLTVLNGTAAWDMGGGRDEYNCVDIDPETIFSYSESDDPLCA
ncbi:MAG: DUF2442 domain-containing protein [Oscillospiraceae bacterium]|nr:DUF2442 domain-containing protein [Oscillospiraceae bacterium]